MLILAITWDQIVGRSICGPEIMMKFAIHELLRAQVNEKNMCLMQLKQGTYAVKNQYTRCVQEEGNTAAQKILNTVFQIEDKEWRGIGIIPASGFCLQPAYADYDAALRFPLFATAAKVENGCISGLVLQGKKKPCECPLFGKQCTPESPFGAPMVSNEGACSAYYHYSRVYTA